MKLKNTLKLVHRVLEEAHIDHALIGGLGLACYGSTRATMDLDLLIHEDDREVVKDVISSSGFTLKSETIEVMQFEGIGLVDFLVARRPLAKGMLEHANHGGPEGIKYLKVEDLIGLKIQAYKNDRNRELQDKADIQYLVQNIENLNWDLIQKYAELFNEWNTIDDMRSKYQS